MDQSKNQPSKGSVQQKAGEQQNEGEGNRTAAKQYNEATERFVKSGKVEEKAREAAKALDGAERRELEDAETVGKRHVAEEDPELKR